MAKRFVTDNFRGVTMEKLKILSGRGGANRGQGRHQKLKDPRRLSVDIEQALMAKLSDHCAKNQVAKKGGGTRSLPRGDLVTAALETYLGIARTAAHGGA